MIRLRILSHDEDTLVVWKPAGLASEHRGDGDSVLSLIAAEHPEAKLPHRLDAVTCGILVVCLTPASIAFANASIQAKRWDKYYLARVAAPKMGAPKDFLGTHRVFLAETRGRAAVVRSGGKPAWLEIMGIAEMPGRPDRWHLLVRLLTGRYHQIRAMCAHLGLPLPGDPLYDPEHREASEFYLEHVVLKYEDMCSRAMTTVFVADAPNRDRLAPALDALLARIVAGGA